MSHDHIELNSAAINWRCRGEFNFTTGFGATKAEHRIANYVALLAPILLYGVVWRDLAWNWGQIAVASFLTLDMVGGVLSNSLGSMKRFLHTKQSLDLTWLGKLVASRWLFPLVHLQLFLVPACFDVSWTYAWVWYGAMLLSIAALHYVPMYLQRPFAMLVVMVAIVAAHSLPAPTGLEWLAPIFIIKLVLSHGVREEPYRPSLND